MLPNILGVIGLTIICGVSSYIAVLLSAFSLNEAIVKGVLIYCLICFLISLGFLVRKKFAWIMFFALLPAPGLIAALYFGGLFTKHIWPIFEHEPPEFTAACKTAVAQFVNPPTLPVHSIAYDWNGNHKPDIGPFLIGSNGRIKQIGSVPKRHQKLDEAIVFTESRRFSDYGLQVTGAKYKRINSNAGTAPYEDGVNVDDLTADILVYYHISPESELAKAPVHQKTVVYDMSITDRRNLQLIATMRYVVDRKDRRLCGPLNNGELRVDDFIANALGLN